MPPKNRPPTVATDAERTAHAELSEPLQQVLRAYEIPYHVWSGLARDRFVTLDDFAARWTDKADCLLNGPTNYAYNHDSADYNERLSRHANSRMGQAWDDACARVRRQNEARHSGQLMLYQPTSDPLGSAPASHTGLTFVRETLQASFALYNNNAKPDIEDEGSNVLLNLLYAPMAAAGNFKMPPDEKITPYIEDPALPTRRRNQRLADGTQATYEDAIAPWLEDQL
jgi:hypothetical protein